MLESWFQKRCVRRLFGPGYSSDDAGDGPSSDSEDEDGDDLGSTVWGDSSDNSEEQFSDSSEEQVVPCLWPIDVIERYLKENDFSIMITYAFEFWDPILVKQQLDLLSLATWTAIQART